MVFFPVVGQHTRYLFRIRDLGPFLSAQATRDLARACIALRPCGR